MAGSVEGRSHEALASVVRVRDHRSLFTFFV
jgi:hypothetical protein